MKITSTGDAVTRVGSERPVRPVEGVQPGHPTKSDQPTGGEIDPRVLDHVVDKMNLTAEVFDKALKFKVVEGHRIIVKVIDTETGKVVQEIPPEKLVEAFRTLEEHIGLLFDRKV